MTKTSSTIHCMVVSVLTAGVIACSAGESQTLEPQTFGPDADVGADARASASDAVASMIPMWMLEDVQPESPRVGQTYGLSAFTEHTVVVALLEGH
jgi:hypothetical protein